MNYTLREATARRHRMSAAALCVWFWLMLLGSVSARAQLLVGQPIDYGTVPLGNTVSLQIVFSAASATSVSSATVLTDGATGKDFNLTNTTCSGAIAKAGNCTATVSFTALQPGARHGILLLYGTTNGSSTTTVVSSVYLHGIGQATQFAFAPVNVTALKSTSTISPSAFTAGAATQDGYGNVYFTDVLNHRILKMDTTGAITSLGSVPVDANSTLAIAPDGTLYASVQTEIFSVLTTQVPLQAPQPISIGTIAFATPTGLAVDATGDLYIADAGNGRIIKYGLSTGTASVVTVIGLSPALGVPRGLAIDANNNLYVVDNARDRIVEIATSTGQATVLSSGSQTLDNPYGITVDPAGTIYVADTGNARLVEMIPSGSDFVLTEPSLSLATPTGVLMKPNGDLIISDTTDGLITVPRSIPQVNFPTPTTYGTLDTADSPASLIVQEIGNSVGQLNFPTSGSQPSVTSSAFSLDPSSTCPVINSGASYTPQQFAVGAVCTYEINFTPNADGNNSGELVIQLTEPGTTTVSTTIVPLNGSGLASVQTFQLVAAPSTTTVGAPVSLTLTALNALGTVATDYTGTVTFTSTDSTGKFLGGNTYTLNATNGGVLYIPAATGIQFNQLGTFTVTATDGTHSALSNPVHVVAQTKVSNFSSSVDPSLVNQTTMLTLTLASSGPAPTGTVNFYAGSTLLGTATLVNGVANLPVSFPVAGTYQLTATYAGDSNNSSVNAGPLQQIVLNPTTATSFTSSVDPSLVNQTTVLTLTLASTGPTPTGTVNFFNGTTLLGSSTLVNGVATLAVSFPIAGVYTLTASYAGDANDAPVSASLQQVVYNPVTILFTSSVNPSLVNQSTVLTATLSQLNGTPTGTIRFYDGTTLLGTATLINGTATLQVSFSTPGIHPLTAVYAGDANNPAAQATLNQDVLEPTVAISLTSSVNPSQINQNTVFTLTLASTGGVPTPTGTVTFYNGTTALGTATLSGGVATLTSSFPTVGSYPITASYGGDTNNAPVTAGPLTQIVIDTNGGGGGGGGNGGGTTSTSIVLTSTVNPSLVNQNTLLTAFLGTTATTGSVTFYDGTTALGTVTVVNGQAGLTLSFAAPGIHPIKAVYSGDSTYASETSAVLQQDVVTPTTGSSFTSSVNPSQINQSTTLTATLVGTTSTPTGTVSFYNGSTLLGTSTLAGGVATLAVSFPAAGAYPLTAVYSGDTMNATATLGPLTQVVLAPGSIVLTSSINPSRINQTTQLTAFLGTTTATGTITFYDGTTTLGSSSVSNGQATLPQAFTTLGIHGLTAAYSGDANNAAITSTVYLQDVRSPDTVVLTTAATHAVAGNPTLLTATVNPVVAGSPGGTVQFYNGTVLLGTGIVTNGVATLSTTFNLAGTQTLTCIYSGDLSYEPSACAPVSLQVIGAPTMTLTSSLNPAPQGASVTFTATVASTASAPTGTVSFYNGTTLLGTSTLAAGSNTATFTTSTLPLGADTINAQYSGDTNTQPASATLVETIVSPATISVPCPVGPLVVGQPVTLSATVSSSAATPTGTVSFYNGTTLLGTAPVVNGVATLSTTFTTAGTLQLSATYSGDTNNGSVSSTTTCATPIVNAATITLTSSANPTTVNTNVTFTAAIGSSGPTPTGTVQFLSNGVALGTATLNGGAALFTTQFAAAGSYTITAIYSGDANTETLTSAPLIEIVKNLATIKLTSSLNPALLNNESTLTATLTSTGPTPTGLITFYDGNAPLGNATIVNGVAVLSVTFPESGSQPLTAVYYGDAVTAGASSAPLLETVGDIALSVANGMPSTGSVLAGGTTSYSLVLTPLITSTLPEAVTLSVQGLPAGATASFSPATIAAGSGATPFTMSVTAAAITAHQAPAPALGSHRRSLLPMLATLLAMPLLLLRRRSKMLRHRLGALVVVLMLSAAAMGLSGCISAADSGYYGQTAKTYTLTVTASSEGLSRTMPVTITVQ